MAEVKWFKLMTNMFEDEKIKLIDAMPERDTVFYVWIRLLDQAARTNAGGYIFLSETIPYTDEMLSTLFNRPLNSIRLALDILTKFEMIQKCEDKRIKVVNWSKYQNIDGMEKIREQTRKRVAKYRAKKELPQSKNGSNDTVTLYNAIEREREEDIDKDKDIDRENKEKTSLSDKAIELCQYYETLKPGQSITQFIDAIEVFIDTYSFDWTKEAIQKCVASKGRFIKPWVEAVLKNWTQEGKEKYKNDGTTKECTKSENKKGIGLECG